MSLILPKRTLSRRRLLQVSGLSGVGFLLGCCGTNLFTDNLRQITEPLNQSLEALLLSQKPVPEFPTSAIEADKLLINTFDFTPQIDPAQFRLTVDGKVNNAMQLRMADIQKLP